jgi:B-cell receptor-associated protein 31
MSFQWTVVAAFVYAEMILIILFMLPWIRPTTWSKIFRSRIVRILSRYKHILGYTVGGVLILLFLDSIRETQKYSSIDLSIPVTTQLPSQADSLIHLRLFRAQRNLYLSGFAIYLSLVIRRMIQLISKEAQLMAAADAAMSQATSASAVAEKVMKDAGAIKVAPGDENKIEDKLAHEVGELQKRLKAVEGDRDAMREQATGLKREYDRLMKDFEQMQHLAEDVGEESEGKKID